MPSLLIYSFFPNPATMPPTLVTLPTYQCVNTTRKFTQFPLYVVLSIMNYLTQQVVYKEIEEEENAYFVHFNALLLLLC